MPHGAEVGSAADEIGQAMPLAGRDDDLEDVRLEPLYGF